MGTYNFRKVIHQPVLPVPIITPWRMIPQVESSEKKQFGGIICALSFSKCHQKIVVCV